MSMFSTYKDYGLLPEIRKCELELIGIKTAQEYGMSQVRGFTSSQLTQNSIARQQSGVDIQVHGLHWKLTFTGENEDMVAIGEPHYSISGVTEDIISYYFLSSPAKNKITLEIYAQHLHIAIPFDPSDSTYSNAFTVTAYMVTNQRGNLVVDVAEGLNGLL